MLAGHNLDIEVLKITDIRKIAMAGVINTPALIINGKLMVSGKLPIKSALPDWRKENIVVWKKKKEKPFIIYYSYLSLLFYITIWIG
ncbi:MAG TPA: thioredoxin family protein [Ignavibacteria bacterium]|nr:thioredoxin family protein [Ignavibacteria bacterium]